MSRKSLIGFGFVMAAAILFVSAGGQEKSSSTPPAGEERYKFSMLVNYDSAEPAKETSDLMQFFKNTLKADLDVTFIPTTAYNDKLGVQIAAADLPHVVGVRSPRSALIIGAVRDGLFWPIDKYLNNPAYPNLQKINSLTLERLTIDGHIYGLPWERNLAISGMFWRQDWMDKLGLKTPATIDEVYEICKAFTERDPDGNGRADTTGLSMKGRNLGDFLSNVAIYYGGKHAWYWDDASGSIRNEVDHPAYQKALDWFRRLYAEGYFIRNLVETTDEFVPFVQGRAGMVFVNTITDAVGAQRDIQKVFPEATVGFTQKMTTPEGKLAMRSNIGYSGAIMFSRTSIKTEAELDKIMRFYNEMGTDENILTLRRGIKDKHYTIVDGYLTVSEAQNKQFNEIDFPSAGRFYPWGVYKPVPEKLNVPLQQAIEESVTSYDGELYLSLSDVLISETQIKLGNSLSDILQDARMKYVLGQLDLAGWKAAVTEWKKAGGDKVAAEYTEDYKKNFGK
ncbi:MAG: extracellular solute-binding protein [Treponema sp.]|jgi:putative aldouronate transport system substrate-binding protein|nr:extracellular solute-binding protein [Treponema sp.]